MTQDEKVSRPSKSKGQKKRRPSGHEADTGKRRKLDQLQHVPTLVSSTFNPLEEVDFPRGAPAHIPVKRKSEAQHDIEEKMESKSFSGKKRQGKEYDMNALLRYDGPKIEGLSFKRLVEGTLVLGQISQISPHDISIALPNNLTGYVPMTGISTTLTKIIETLAEGHDEEAHIPSLDEMFTVGQWVRAVVVANTAISASSDKKKHIELSLHPTLVDASIPEADIVPNTLLQASVISIEDHGIIVSLGLPNLTGFINKSLLGGYKIENINEGQVFLACVVHKPNNKVVQLSLDLTPSRAPIPDFSDIASILPGATVQFLVSEIREAGAGGKILGLLDATIDRLHIGESSVSENKMISARVTAVFPSAEPRRVMLSLLPHIRHLDIARTASGQLPLDALPVGFVVETAKIVQVVQEQCVYIDTGVAGVKGFAHISRLSDQRLDSLSPSTGPFKISSVHRGRITGYNPVDNLYLLSFEQHILDQPFLRIEDVEIGSKLETTVERLLDRGVVVRLAEGITGWIPLEQSADVLPTAAKKNFGKEIMGWENRFKLGTKVKCRLLNVDLTRRRILLTAKKTLLNSALPILTSYSPSIVGHAFHGTVYSVTQYGAVVEFYSEVRGYLPVSELSEAYVSDAREHLRLGQTVKTWVLDVDESEKRLRLSLKDQTYWSHGGEIAFKSLKEGSILAATISAKFPDNVILSLSVDDVILRGMINVNHLTDSPGSKCERKQAKLREGTKLQEVLVLNKNVKTRVVTCSMKPALIEAAKEGTLPTKYEDLYRGRRVTGWIKNVEDFGAFVAFAGEVEGVVYKKELADDRVSDPHAVLQKGQVVTAIVVSVDAEQRRSHLTLRTNAQVDAITDDPTDAIHPLDDTIRFIEDYHPGRLTFAKVIAVKQTQANVALAENLQGRIDVSEVFDSICSDYEHPLKSMKKGSILQVRILGFHDSRTHRYLPLTHRKSNIQTILELSCKPAHIASNPLPLPTLDDIEVGKSYPAYINTFTGDYLWLNISPTIRGRMHILNLTDRIEELQNLGSHYSMGSGLHVTVLGKTGDGKYLDFSVRKNIIRSIQSVSSGSILPGRISKVLESGLMVQIGENVFGKVGLTDISDTYTPKLTEDYRENMIVRVCVLDVDAPNKRIALSMRSSRTLNSTAKQIDREIASISSINVGDVIRGFVSNIPDSGLFVLLGRGIIGRVLIRDLSDQFLEDWKSHFKVNQLVRGKVLSVDAPGNKVGLSLKPSVVDGKSSGKGFADIHEGDRLSGVVSRIEEYGIFIKLVGYNLSGLCHKSEISDSLSVDFRKLYDEGDRVKVLVLKVDLERKRVSLGLKASYFDDVNGDMSDVAEDESNVVDEAGDVIETDSEPQDEATMQIDSFTGTPTESQPAPLAVESFDWTGEMATAMDDRLPQESESESESEAYSEEDKIRHSKRKHKRSEIKYDKTISPSLSSAADYERILISKPDSSLLWTQYMAHLLQLGQIDQARSVAERALSTINVREEGEKLNIWVAYLNMENSFGSEEKLHEVFHRACQYADKKMHSHLASIFIKTGKFDKAEELFHTMIKKFSQSSKVWVNYATYLMEHDRAHDARELLPQSLKILPKRKHVKTVTKFGQMEFKLSSAEHGRTIMTGLLANYPRRFDLWSIFLDLEIRDGSVDVIRRLFQRVLALNMSTKKAKFFFKKWLQWETKIGDTNGAEDVKRRAKEYVEGLTAKESHL